MSRALLGTTEHINGNLREQHHSREKAARAGHTREPCEGCAHGQAMSKAGVVVGILGVTWDCCRSTAMKDFGLESTARAISNHRAGKSQVTLSQSAKQHVLGGLSGLNSSCL